LTFAAYRRVGDGNGCPVVVQSGSSPGDSVAAPLQRKECPMSFDYSPKTQALLERMNAFYAQHIYPNEATAHAEMEAMRRAGDPWQPLKIVDELKAKARDAGLWNMFLPHPYKGQGGISNLDYAPLCELMGRSIWSSEVFNCSAPDTGNMETLERYGTDAQKKQWLEPLLDGKIRSAFLMTEPAVASSDATNIQCSIKREGNEYVINGVKWFSSGAGNPRCAVFIVMGKTDPDGPRHAQQSMVLVPRDAKGVRIVRPLTVFNYDDAPHGHMEVALDNVRVPVENILLGEGRGFEIAQGRLGPGRIHHCMRSIGAAERALEMMVDRLQQRIAFGKALSEQSVWHERIADSRCMIDQARLLTLNAAHRMDVAGNKAARAEIAMIKVVAPNMSCKVVDWAIQAHGAAGISQDFWLAEAYAHQRTVRIVDGPDEVHRNAIAKIELGKRAALRQ
jgi:acyl-CoA dehydrogenase